jgi:hypothetical protein
MNYTKYQKTVANIGEGKVAKVFGWLFIGLGIYIILSSIFPIINWNLKKGNYDKQYIATSDDSLIYEFDGETIYIDNLYNTDGEKIVLELPDKQTGIAYCEKNNPKNCIYFDLNNSFDDGTLNPAMPVFASLFLLSIGLYFILTLKLQDKEEESLKPLIALFLSLFLLGVSALTYQAYLAVNYLSLKSQNNVTTATIYSEIFKYSGTNRTYKPVASYYIDGEKYIYVKDFYIKGSLEENESKTFELYYDSNDFNKVSEKKNPINITLLLVGIGCTLPGSLGLFRKNKIEENIANYNKQITDK